MTIATDWAPGIVSNDDAVAHDVSQVGQKAASLAWLARRGLRVPPFAVVTVDATAKLIRPVGGELLGYLARLDCNDAASLRWTARAILDLVTAQALPEPLQEELTARLAAFGAGTRFAVRSSAIGEDSVAHSFAGQLDTHLDLAPQDVGDAILACLASAYSERILVYRARRGMSNELVQVAVIVQVLVDSAVAGVAFTCNPQSGDQSEAVVTAGLGLGDRVVSGAADCDTFFVDVSSRDVITRIVNHKSPILTDQQVGKIAGVALDLADATGRPLDIEWAFDYQGRLHLLQCRPVTTPSRQKVFDNVNVTESYPGLTLPLTFSFVRLCYERIFRTCHRDFGATRRDTEAVAADLFPYLLGFVRGRVYYNIGNWYRLFLTVPGMERAIPAWEAALGIDDRFRAPAQQRQGLAWVVRLIRELRTFIVLAVSWRRLPRRVRVFSARYAAFRSEIDRQPLDELAVDELLDLLDRFLAELVPPYSVQIFNDFVAQQLFQQVARLIDRYEVADDADSLRNELFCGVGEVDSVGPVRSAVQLATQVASDTAQRDLFQSSLSPEAVWRTVSEDQQFANLHEAWREHIHLYGDRIPEELKLETDQLDEHPWQLVSLVRTYLHGGQRVDAMEAHERAIRQSAEAKVRGALSRRPGRRLVFGYVLRRARWGIAQRENLRLGRSRCFGLAKRIYRAIGRRLADSGVIEGPRDVFWLTREEVEAIGRGTFVDGDACRLVQTRKQDYDAWRDEHLPSRIVTSLPVFDDLPSQYQERASKMGHNLRGVGCGPGIVHAPVLVLDQPDRAGTVNGEVLVASATDPGWVFLMVAAGGLVSEKGSILSHTAIIGRELGIPTVVGVKDATRLLTDGQMVTLDGQAGTVTTTGPSDSERGSRSTS